jgi:hypothetical protein
MFEGHIRQVGYPGWEFHDLTLCFRTDSEILPRNKQLLPPSTNLLIDHIIQCYMWTSLAWKMDPT